MTEPHVESSAVPSYSQVGEDRILHFLFSSIGSPSNLRYADVGAAFPDGHNNTYLFYTLGGSGVLVEADPKYLDAYAKMRPRDSVEQVAIVPAAMAQGGSVTFHAMENPGWSTVSSKHLEVAAQLNKGRILRSITVPCLTINQLLERHFPNGKLDILSLDIEGVDEQVLAELDFERFAPTAIVIEGTGKLSHDAGDHAPGIDRLSAAGYQLYAWSYVNYIYVNVSHIQNMRI